jgi:hypothetical protein
MALADLVVCIEHVLSLVGTRGCGIAVLASVGSHVDDRNERDWPKMKLCEDWMVKGRRREMLQAGKGRPKDVSVEDIVTRENKCGRAAAVEM